MAVTDSTSGKVIRRYSIEELKEAANLMRGYDLVALHAAGSGHAGGTLSIMDITAALYLEIANHDPQNPNWSGRDRIVWSTGHKAPSLYLGLAFAGFYAIDDVVTITPRPLSAMGCCVLIADAAMRIQLKVPTRLTDTIFSKRSKPWAFS